MSGVLPDSRLCPQCSQPMSTSPCVCGYQEAAPVSASVTDSVPLSEWLQAAGRRALSVITFQTEATEIPLPSALITMGVRALLLAFVGAKLYSSYVAIAFMANPYAALMTGRPVDVTGKAFAFMLLGLVLAGGAALGILYALVPRNEFNSTAAALSDSQIPMLSGMMLALLMGTTFPALGYTAMAAGIAWGQAVLTQGLMRTSVSARTRMLMQIAIVSATVFVLFMCSQIGPSNQPLMR